MYQYLSIFQGKVVIFFPKLIQAYGKSLGLRIVSVFSFYTAPVYRNSTILH